MLSLRSPVIFLAPSMGLAAGAAAWLLAGGGGGMAAQLTAFEKALPTVPKHFGSSMSGGSAAQALANPIFALTTGPNAVADLAINLSGIAKTERRSAVLVSLNGGPVQWMRQGETQDGVTLQEVQSSKAVFDTPTGFKEVVLGQSSTPPAGSAPNAPVTAVGASLGATPPAPTANSPAFARASHIRRF